MLEGFSWPAVAGVFQIGKTSSSQSSEEIIFLIYGTVLMCDFFRTLFAMP